MKVSEIKVGSTYAGSGFVAGKRIVTKIDGGDVEWWIPGGVSPHVMSLKGFARWSKSESQPAVAVSDGEPTAFMGPQVTLKRAVAATHV